MTHPHPRPHNAPLRRRAPRRSPPWLWGVLVAGATAVIGAFLFVKGWIPVGSTDSPSEPGTAAGTAETSPSTPSGRDIDPYGWEACRRLQDLGATTFDRTTNKNIGQLAERSNYEEIASRGKALVNAASTASDKDPIDANLSISRAQLDLQGACERVFGAEE